MSLGITYYFGDRPVEVYSHEQDIPIDFPRGEGIAFEDPVVLPFMNPVPGQIRPDCLVIRTVPKRSAEVPITMVVPSINSDQMYGMKSFTFSR